MPVAYPFNAHAYFDAANVSYTSQRELRDGLKHIRLYVRVRISPTRMTRENDGSAAGDAASGDAVEGATPLARSLVEAIPAPALACDPQSLAIRAANDPAVALFGRDRSALTLMGITDLCESSVTVEGDPVDETLREAADADTAVTAEWTVAVDGDRRRLAVRAHETTLADHDWLVAAVTDVTARVRAERSARLRSRTLDAVAETMPLALFRCDAGGTLLRWNDRAVDDTGYDAAELSGRSLPDLFDDDSRPAISDGFARVCRERTSVERDATLLTRSGEQVTYRLTLGPVTDGDELAGVVGIGEDRTEASVREERLAVLTRVLRHNFRNELNVVLGFSEQARQAVDDPATVAQLDRVVDTAGRLLHLGETSRKVEQLLATSPTPGPISFSTAVETALDSLPDQLCAAADIDVDVPAGLTVSAVDRFPDALAELVDNAIRHSDAERPRVRIAATELPSESWASLVVADNGPGIPPAERAVLTGTETQLDHTSGLGLWYVHWVVTAGGGSLDIAESSEAGSRIELTLKRPDGR